MILLVDDDARSARTLARLLREDGFSVELASDVAMAIARLVREPIPDALIIDLRMPHADGFAVARYARTRCVTMPVLMVTGYPEVASWAEPTFDPPALILTKPLSYEELTARLRIAGVTIAA